MCALAFAVPAAAAATPNPPKPDTKRSPKPPAGHTIFQSPMLWATIDVCDGPTHPHTVGVRGSMPGSGKAGEEMYMRFQVQYRGPQHTWVDLGPTADSGFVAVGAATFKARQAGRDFVVSIPAASAYRLRGVVTFEWRAYGRVVRHARKRTSAGHRSRAGADPPGFSAATCMLR